MGDHVVETGRHRRDDLVGRRPLQEDAARAGRLGVSSSVLGRVAELGGRAELSTGSYGTEWELTFPR